MAPPKTQKKPEVVAQTPPPGSELPVIHVLTMAGNGPYLPMHIILRGETVLGVKPLSAEPLRKDHAFDQVKIATTRLFRDRKAFGSELPQDLIVMDVPTVQAVGITRTKEGRYVPLAVKIEGKSVRSYSALFSSALTLNEALSVYKSRMMRLFSQGKSLLE